MSIVSKIEWTEATWNPVTGCTKISKGCQNCYAATLAKRLKAMGNKRYLNEFEVTVHEDLIDKPLEWKKSKMIFVNSMSDLFHDEVKDETILKIFDTMNKAYWHTFQVLTKRPERLVELSSRINWTDNIWMGVTVEENDYIERCDLLKQTGAHIKFVSAEPLLGNLSNLNLNGIDWLIVGGESDRQARVLDYAWVLDVRRQCVEAKTAFTFRQCGTYFRKDDVLYHMKTKDLGWQARKAGIDYDPKEEQ